MSLRPVSCHPKATGITLHPIRMSICPPVQLLTDKPWSDYTLFIYLLENLFSSMLGLSLFPLPLFEPSSSCEWTLSGRHCDRKYHTLTNPALPSQARLHQMAILSMAVFLRSWVSPSKPSRLSLLPLSLHLSFSGSLPSLYAVLSLSTLQ